MVAMDTDTRNVAANLLAEICHRLSRQGFVVATDGNVSVRLPHRNILVTRSGVNKGLVRPDDLVEVHPDGTPLSAVTRPSTELGMHLQVYRRRPDVHAVCHAHPPFATAFAVAGIPLDKPVLPEILIQLGTIPVAPYATPSTDEVSASLVPLIDDHDAILLANHGVLTCGSDLNDAYSKMEKVEHAAAILYRASMLGGPRTLTPRDVERLRTIAPAAYGRESRG